MQILETERLIIRRFSDSSTADPRFIVELLNDAAFLEHIGDRGVRDEEDARRYLRDGPMVSYQQHGFGLNRVELKEGGQPIGMCGLLRRDHLDHPDIGFAYLPAFRSQGYGYEAAAAVIAHGRQTFGLGRLLAITSPKNTASIGLLEKLGFALDSNLKMPGEQDEIRLFAADP